MNILDAVKLLRPGTDWNLRGDVLEQSDAGPRVVPPTLTEIQDLLDSQEYKELRREAYPPIGDQLDALWKGGQDAEDMAVQIRSVKTSFPKP